MFIFRLPKMEKLKSYFCCMQASLPVQEYLFMPYDQAHKQYETARHLPPPLYVLFVQATAYGQACGKYGGQVRERGCGSRGCVWLTESFGSTACRGKLPGLAPQPSGDKCCLPSALPSMAALTSWPEAGLTWWAFQNGWL